MKLARKQTRAGRSEAWGVVVVLGTITLPLSGRIMRYVTRRNNNCDLTHKLAALRP